MQAIKCTAVFFLLISLSKAASLQLKFEPAFCHDLDCPKYKVVASKNAYETRKYDPSKWVGTTIPSMNYTYAVNEGFKRLFQYIEGKNQDKIKIPMASPVATKIVPGQGPACDSNFTVLFFVPFAYQRNTPIPTNPELAIVDLPAITVYVAQFGGYETDDKLLEYATKLATALDNDKMPYVKDYYFTAGYDPPYRFIGRHNEVWFLAD